MLKGLTAAGVGKFRDLEHFIELASANGFEAIDVSGAALHEWIQAHDTKYAQEKLAQANITIGAIGLAVDWRRSEAEFMAQLPNLHRDAAAAQAVGCKACTTYILPSIEQNAAHFLAIATRRLRLCAQILAAYHIRLGLEFVGPHHLRHAQKNPFIWNLESTLDWIEAIHEPNVGLLLDSFHSYTTEPDFDHLLQLSPEQIVHVHINDAPDVPVSEVKDNERLYPGEGVIPLTDFLEKLARTGYQGVVSQEILTPQPVQESAEILIPKSASAFASIWPQLD